MDLILLHKTGQTLRHTNKKGKVMTKENLRKKAVKIKGKDYVLVSDRIIAFNERYGNGSIVTELVSAPGSQTYIIKATVVPDVDKPERKYTGYSQATVGLGQVNKIAALENAETSAVGRALGMMGIGVLDSIASADEMMKARVSSVPQEKKKPVLTPENPRWQGAVQALKEGRTSVAVILNNFVVPYEFLEELKEAENA